MADFVDDEAEESEEEHDLNPREKKRAKRSRAMDDSDEDEEDDEARYREELKGFVDDNLIESDAEDSDADDAPKKRKNRDDEDFDDRLEDDDYDLLEENLGISVKRKRFKRLRRIEDRESDEEPERQPDVEREAIANEIFDAASGDDDELRSVRSHRQEPEVFNEEGSEGEESDADDFIVDEDDRPIAEKRRKKRPVFTDAALQQAQDIFGVDFDYEEIQKHGEDGEDREDEDEEDEEYDCVEDEGADERPRRSKKAPKKKGNRRTIFEIYEPIELQRGHFTDRDHEIRNTDIPERMQTRSVPMIPVPDGSNELELEAEWIYKQAFCRPTISIQDAHLSDEAKERACKGPQTVPKIKKALDFMRNQNFEVPFISFYRKEYVLPELNINDLWKVYRYDAKWCELRQRKENLLSLFEKMRNYQLDEVMKNPDAPLPESVRIIKEDDIDQLKSVETSEELNDVHHHFTLYYGNEIPKMQSAIREREKFALREEKLRKHRQMIAEALENGEDPPVDEVSDPELETEPDDTLKQAVKSGSYALCQKAGLDGFAKKFGLTPEQYAENLRDNYQRHEVEQDPTEPFLTAMDYRGPMYDDPEAILKAVQVMVAIQLAREPLVRKCVREMYMERAKISVRPTKKGMKEIDENHPIYAMKYLKDKPVGELVGDQFLKLSIAEQDKLVEISFSDVFEGNTSDNYVDEMKQLYHRDEFSKNVQDWNALRVGAAEMALSKMVIPDMKKELRSNLMAESKEFVLRTCCRKMYNWIKDAPYRVSFDQEAVVVEEDDWDTDQASAPKANDNSKNPEWDTTKGIRVMGIAYVPDYTQAAFACLISPSGECTDYLKIPHILKRKNSFREDEKAMKETALEAVKNFISTKKPHVIVIGGESREATMLSEDLQECLTTLATEEQFPAVKVEICDNELAKIYANSNRAIEEFRDYPILLRQAISMARRLQDPLVEFSQLCTPDEEILCLKYHPYQDQISKDDLLENLYLEFVNRVNEVGVDVNRAAGEGYSGNLVQFVCGFGSRKAQALLKTLKQTNQRIENRTQLVTICHMGPKIFINCAGFVKIDTASLGDSTEAYVEVLDGSRVHPETYEWARKMAVDALEYDDEEANPAGALEEIIESPERLKDLDLDAFAEELERQGFGDKCTTLYDIRAELNCRYKDLRAPYESPTPEKLFDMLTKETPETFYIGKLIMATVTRLNYRKPEGEQLDQANPVRDDDTGLWQCPFCMKNDFPELSEVWNHFDAGTCPGKAIGIRLRLDNGVSGYINIRNLSDKHVKNPEERVRPGQVIHCRIIKIEVDRFSVECTSKSSDLADANNEMRPQRDPYYDVDAEERDTKVEEDAKKLKQQRAYIKRVIVHPSFHNISYSEAAKLMGVMKQGEAIVRPSSKGENHLTVTWKVTDDILHHIDVREEGKKFGFSLGKKLWIGTEEFEDLDEIIARHVNPMASYASELLECHYYTANIDGVEAKAEEVLKERKINKPSSIPCIISPSKAYPAKFMLSYLPRERCKHEYVSVTPNGVRFRGQVFPTIGQMFSWFKKNFRDTRTVATPKTPCYATPGGNQEPSDDYSHLGADEPSYSFTMDTPGVEAADGYSNAPSLPNTPYTPSGPTPFMTPFQTPASTPQTQATPKYGQQTPGQNGGKFVQPSGPPSTGVHYKTTHKVSMAGPNFLADPDRGRPVGTWKQSESGSFTFSRESSYDDLSSNTSGTGLGESRGRGGFRGRGDFRDRGDWRGRGNSRGGRGDHRGGRGDSRGGRGDYRGGRGDSRGGRGDYRGGRGDSRGGRGNSRGSYDSYGDRSNSGDTSAGNTTPLWDENESWDSPGKTTARNDSSAAKTPVNSDASGNRTPLWDENETWDSPGQANLPSGSPTDVRSNPAPSIAPTVSSGGPRWDTEESWDDPEPTPSRNPQTSSGQRPFHGAPRNASTPSNSRQSFRDKFASSRGSAMTNSGTGCESSENWDSAPPTSSSSITPINGPQWGTDENWDDDEPTPAKTVQPASCPPAPRQPLQENSPYDCGPSSGPGRQYSRGGRQFNSGQSRPAIRQPPSGGQQHNYSAPFNAPIAPSAGPMWDTAENWDDDEPTPAKTMQPPPPPSCPPVRQAPPENLPSGPAGRQPGGCPRENQQHNSASFIAPIAPSTGPSWDTDENWDDDEPTPAKTAQPPACPPVRQAFPENSSSRPAGRQPPRETQQHNSAATTSAGPRWDTDENWDDDEPAPAKTVQPAKPPANLRSQAPAENNSELNAGPFVAPIIPAAGPRWDADESWDDDEPPAANRTVQPPSVVPSPQAPRNAQQFASPSPQFRQPFRGASQFASPNPQSRQPFRGASQFTSPNLPPRQSQAPVSHYSSPSAPVVPNASSMWGDEENWDDDDPAPAPKTGQTSQPAASQAPRGAGPSIAPVVSSTSGPAWDTNESWDDEPGSTSVSASASQQPPRQPPQNDFEPPSASPFVAPNAPQWDDNENWDDDAAPTPATAPARSFPTPMSAPPPRQPTRNQPATQSYRQPRFNNPRPVAQGSYREYRENKERAAGQGSYREHRENKERAAGQGSYREHRENKERAAIQGSYRQDRQSNGGPSTRFPYQRPPRNDGGTGRAPYQQNPRNDGGTGCAPYQQNPRNDGGTGRAPYQQNPRNDGGTGRAYRQPPQNAPSPSQAPTDTPQNDCVDPLSAPVILTNTASLFGVDESWD